MKCPKCDTENTQDSQYCKKCATSLFDTENAQPQVTKTIETPREELTTGSAFAGRYQIIEELGKGGMGKVYKAIDTDIKEKVAIKLIKPEISTDKKTIERFQNELKFARKIRHKNVCQMYDLNREEGTYYITMEYVSGGDLKSFIRRSRQLAIGTAITITKQICDGLSEAHKLGVVHRDLKPSNIMIDSEGNVRIMDFGIARSLKEKGITGAGVMIGTPEYMSPEQVEAKETDQRSDIYSLGIILYEMVTGQVPFEGDTPFSIGVKQKSENPRPPKEINAQIPEDLNRVILKCLEKEKESRYQSAGELHSELRKLEKGIPIEERIVTERKPLTAREITVQFSLKKLLIPAVIAIAIAIIGVVLWQLLPHKEALLAPKIENSIAVISFKNQTGDPAYDHLQEAIPNLLITNLENTELFYVATWERMKDILKQMGDKQANIIGSDLGFELCRREGIQAIAIGTFSMAGDIFTTDVKVYDVETKRTLKSANDKGMGVDSIFESQIDNLSREISLGLGVGMDKVEAAKFNIKGITTHSLEAYKYLLKGIEACNLMYWAQARDSLEKALELDPAFAMAYVYLAWTYVDPGPEKAIAETLEKAIALADRSSQKDRLYLDGLYAYFVEIDTAKAVKYLDELLLKYPDEKWALHISGDFVRKDGDLDNAYSRYKKWLELDPQDGNALYHISGVCISIGDLDEAEEYIKMYEAVAPHEYGDLGKQALLYQKLGQVDNVLRKYHEMHELRPDSTWPLRQIVFLSSLKEEYEEALNWANESLSIATSSGQKSSIFLERGDINFLRGAFDDARADYIMVIQIEEQAEVTINKAWAFEAKGFIHLYRGEYEASRKSFEDMFASLLEYHGEIPPSDRVDWAYDMGMLAIVRGQIGQANARLSEIESLLPEILEEQVPPYNLRRDLLQGEVLLAQGALDEALAVGKKAYGPESPHWVPGTEFYALQAYYMDLTARIYFKKGEIGQAILEYERLLETNFATGLFFPVNPLYHYRLGLLYEQANDIAKSKAEFEKFLELWKDADPGLSEVRDAKERVTKLKD